MRHIALCGLAVLILVLAACAPALASDYNYITPDETKSRIMRGETMHILDIQVADEFAQGHLPGALKSCAYPVKSDEDRAKLAAHLETLKADAAPVVIVCPRGGGGAKRTYDYLKDQGFQESRLLILEEGQKGWPYPEMLEKE